MQSMAKVRKILVAVDFGENSKRCLNYAYEFFKGGSVEFHVVHVVRDTLPEGSYIPHRSVENMLKDALELATKELQKFIPRKILSSGEDVHPIVLEGEPYSVLIDYAQEKKLELLVLGSQGTRGVEKMLLGNVTDKVIRKSPIPVLVYKD
jgi:nucleotide-binding universal stress UspA family protein